MSGFKLIATRPLDGCGEKFLKNLNKGEVYQFYENYKFYNAKNEITKSVDEVVSIKCTDNTLNTLYKIEVDTDKFIDVNICAIVGKNGSGKSAITELLLYTLFVLSNKVELIDESNFLNTESKIFEDILEVKKYNNELINIQKVLSVELYYLQNNCYKKLTIKNDGFTALLFE